MDFKVFSQVFHFDGRITDQDGVVFLFLLFVARSAFRLEVVVDFKIYRAGCIVTFDLVFIKQVMLLRVGVLGPCLQSHHWFN